MLRSKLAALSLALGLMPPASMADCVARDFLALPLPEAPERPAIALALELAYEGLAVDEAAGVLTYNGQTFALGEDPGRRPQERLADPSIAETFAQVYPLAFDLGQREQPWFDPGRARSDALFKALYGAREAEVAASLKRADFRRGGTAARFSASSRQCVASQLQAALDAIAAEGPEVEKVFAEVGGSFNWRKIAGTSRLSAHSFGIAVDFNTALGGYWRWSGGTEGNAGAYRNQYPEAVVRQMERYGFIWGGKWHHFDGMHFEYRPELILHARLVSG
ncbi:M15 family metallopeptidase [Vannielia litorea]|uniref:M15 family metallopeptidase n=1 Tax=Vannielia litorea TaxID=1217970 RepID=UPI001C97DC5D|nr:M15 family metallopeptidase [Vannielia litorea]MBY6152617.1 M15 family metallopeptidase [Vannielia litorea]